MFQRYIITVQPVGRELPLPFNGELSGRVIH